MDFVKVVAPVRDVEIEDIGVLVPKGMSRVVCGEDLARTEDMWELLRRGELLQILSKFSRPLKSEPPASLESESDSAVGSSPDLTADVERRLDAVIEDMRPSNPPPIPNALRKLVEDTKDVAPLKQHKRKGKR